jgi:hypothetical protein
MKPGRLRKRRFLARELRSPGVTVAASDRAFTLLSETESVLIE